MKLLGLFCAAAVSLALATPALANPHHHWHHPHHPHHGILGVILPHGHHHHHH